MSRLAKPMHDYQRSLVYKWEDSILGLWQSELLSDSGAMELIYRMCSDLLLPAPDVRFTKRNGGGVARPESLSFTPDNCRKLLVIHEFAHYCNPTGDHHGPQFVANYVELITRYANRGARADQLANNAAEYGICSMRFAKFGVHRRNTLPTLSLDDL